MVLKCFFKDSPSDLRGGGWAVFLCRIFFLVALGLQDFFLVNAGIFLVVALLHVIFFLLFFLARFFLGNCPAPSQGI